eukprot:scpid70792/ scgid18721/ 
MATIASLLLVALVAVASGRSPTIDVVQPSEIVTSDCYERAQPHLHMMHLSLHAHRHRVHDQCRRSQQEHNEFFAAQKERLRQTIEDCERSAHNLAAGTPTAAAELEASCHEAEAKMRQSLGEHVSGAADLHEQCARRLRQVHERVQSAGQSLFHVLAGCAPEHACILLRLSKAKMQRLSSSVQGLANLDVGETCALPSERLGHKVRRMCERFSTQQAIVNEASSNVYDELHETLDSHCAGSRAQDRDMVTGEHSIVTEEVRLFEEDPTTEQQFVPKFVPEILPEMPTLPVEPNYPAVTEEVKKETSNGWNPLWGLGPVQINKNMPAGQEDIGLMEPEQKPDGGDGDHDHDHDKQSDHHRHHKRRYVTVAVATGCVCVVVCVAVAAFTANVLRRRYRNSIQSQQPEKRNDVAKKALLDEEEEIRSIEQKGFENPTYNFFEHLQEEA